jgi:heterotetrameric sarcosine oxidase delta subunit
MNQLQCPFCGPRELQEFEFRKTRANVTTSEFSKVYLRVDSVDVSVEHWQHVQGCRAWLLVERNPSTGAVLGIEALPAVMR